jgi:hypothetical protein
LPTISAQLREQMLILRRRTLRLGCLVHSAPHTREVNGIRAVCRTPIGDLKAFSVLPGSAVPSRQSMLRTTR